MENTSIPVKRLPQRLIPLREAAFRQELRQAITAMFRPAVIFELASSTKLDGPMIDFLIRCARDAAEHDAESAVAATNPEHRVLLELIRLNGVLPAFRSVEEAAVYLEKSRKPKSVSSAHTPDLDSAPASESAPEAASQS